jgi:murein DD-endopeptidase MepM/ murein hydrolase activator NlpD
MLLLGTALAVCFHAAPTLEIQPGSAFPGDVVLIKVSNVQSVPAGEFDSHSLVFLRFHSSFVALMPLSVNQDPGEIEINVTTATQQLSGHIEVKPPNFRKRELKVSKRFTNPSRKERQRSAADTKAFSRATDVDFEEWKFSTDFVLPRNAELTAPFGDERILNHKKQSQHFGVDLDGDTGDPIYASNEGEVVLVRDCFASGNTVLVHHGGRLFTSYFHMSSMAVKVGQHVKQGDLLGKVGKTGRVTGPHLHWGVKLDGKWVNPIALTELSF